MRFGKYVCMLFYVLFWDFVENGLVRPTTPKAKWDKATLALVNANSKAINAIFFVVFQLMNFIGSLM